MLDEAELTLMSAEADTFNPSTLEVEQENSCKFEAGPVYIAKSKPTRAIKQDPVSKQTNDLRSTTDFMFADERE